MSDQDVLQGKSATVRVTSTMRVEVLARLLKEYSDRLNQKVEALSRQTSAASDPLIQELLQDVSYLISQTTKLVDKASSYREYLELEEGERFELELRLFDSEDALRSANRAIEKKSDRASAQLRIKLK